jgi:hypothetical protein
MTMDELIIYIDKKSAKKGVAAEKFSFIVAGFTLLISVYDSLIRPVPYRTFIDIFYLSISSVAGILNIIFAFFITKIKPESKKVFIYRFLLAVSGIVLISDGFNKLLQHHKAIQYALMFAGLLYLIVALFYNEMQKRKNIKLKDNGILYSGSIFKKRLFQWNDINSIQFDDRKISVITNSGKHHNFPILSNGNEFVSDFQKKLTEEVLKRKIKLESSLITH